MIFGFLVGLLLLIGGFFAFVASKNAMQEILAVLLLGFGTLAITIGWGLSSIYNKLKEVYDLLNATEKNTASVARFFNERDVKIE